jgi:chromosome segregation ATPase
MSLTAPPGLEAALQSKNSTIESMEIEISNLRAQLDRVASGSSVEKEQIAALEDKLARSERSAAIAQRELGDLKKNLERTTEKAVKEGSERTSAETKLRTLEREAEEAKVHSEELQKKVDALEKKVATLTTLHKEHDARFQTQKREREKAEKESSDLRARLAGLENENIRLREERERARKRDAEGIDDDGVDELENEERQRLEKKVRELEGEVHELRRGIWRERRRELDGEDSSGVTSPGARFTDVDLGGSTYSSRRKSIPHGGKGIGDFLTSGFNAITGGTSGADGGLLEDDDLDFDEDAFRLAQEEEARKRIERVKETKRALKNWTGWRLDLVENRKGGGEGVGEIFEI